MAGGLLWVRQDMGTFCCLVLGICYNTHERGRSREGWGFSCGDPSLLNGMAFAADVSVLDEAACRCASVPQLGAYQIETSGQLGDGDDCSAGMNRIFPHYPALQIMYTDPGHCTLGTDGQ